MELVQLALHEEYNLIMSWSNTPVNLLIISCHNVSFVEIQIKFLKEFKHLK